jgi:hypothetical protein
MYNGKGSWDIMESSLGSSKSCARGGGTLKRCGDGYVCTAEALRFAADVVDEPFAALSRFFSESFFSLCSRCTGTTLGAGVFDGWREAGFNGEGTMGACS